VTQQTPLKAAIQYHLLISLVVIILHLLTIIEILANLLHCCLSTQQYNDESISNCCKLKTLCLCKKGIYQIVTVDCINERDTGHARATVLANQIQGGVCGAVARTDVRGQTARGWMGDGQRDGNIDCFVCYVSDVNNFCIILLYHS